MDTQLILAEGFIDTTKKTLKKVIDKIIELCKKFISFLKDKLTKGLDATEQMIAKVKKLYKEAGAPQPTPETTQTNQSDRIVIINVAEMVIRDSDAALDVFDDALSAYRFRRREDIPSLAEEFFTIHKKIRAIFRDKDKRLMKPYHHEGVEVLDQISNLIASIREVHDRCKSYATSIVDIANYCKKNSDTVGTKLVNTIAELQNGIMLLCANLYTLISIFNQSIKVIKEKNNVRRSLSMNELYEMTLESQDIQLLVTEGIVSGSKKLINTAITKLKELLKRIVNFIKEKIQAGSKAVKALLSKIKGQPREINTENSELKVLNISAATRVVQSMIDMHKEVNKIVGSIMSTYGDNTITFNAYKDAIDHCEDIYNKYHDDLMITYKNPRDLDVLKLGSLEDTISDTSRAVLTTIDRVTMIIKATKRIEEDGDIKKLLHNLINIENNLMDMTRRLNLVQSRIEASLRVALKLQYGNK